MDTEQTLQQRIGHAVRVIARDKGITLKALAESLEMSKQSFYDRLRGKTTLSVDDLDRLAEELEVPVGVLLDDPHAWYAPRGSNPEPAGQGYIDLPKEERAQLVGAASDFAAA